MARHEHSLAALEEGRAHEVVVSEPQGHARVAVGVTGGVGSHSSGSRLNASIVEHEKKDYKNNVDTVLWILSILDTGFKTLKVGSMANTLYQNGHDTTGIETVRQLAVSNNTAALIARFEHNALEVRDGMKLTAILMILSGGISLATIFFAMLRACFTSISPGKHRRYRVAHLCDRSLGVRVMMAVVSLSGGIAGVYSSADVERKDGAIFMTACLMILQVAVSALSNEKKKSEDIDLDGEVVVDVPARDSLQRQYAMQPSGGGPSYLGGHMVEEFDSISSRSGLGTPTRSVQDDVRVSQMLAQNLASQRSTAGAALSVAISETAMDGHEEEGSASPPLAVETGVFSGTESRAAGSTSDREAEPRYEPASPGPHA